MRIAMFGTKPYDRRSFLAEPLAAAHELTFLESRLDRETVSLASGNDAVCVFVNDTVDAAVIAGLAKVGVKLIALRCAGFNNVDLSAAAKAGIAVARVPAYSPHAVAEFTTGMILTLNRHIHRAFNRVRDNNFALDGLLGFDLAGKTVGVVGTGRIGALVARAMRAGFGCEVLAHDLAPDSELLALGVAYVEVHELIRRADIVTLHCPLTPETRHLINAQSLTLAKPGFMLVNTSRGALIDATAVIEALKTGRIGHLAIDVYEQEADLFFEDLSSEIIADDVFQRLLTFPNVLVTGHQAFFTREALSGIAGTTLANIDAFAKGRELVNAVRAPKATRP